MLTTQQLATLKAAIDADPVLLAYPNDGDGAYAIATILNADAAPEYWIWRENYTPDLIRAAITNGITQLDALTASKRDSLLWLAQGSHDMRNVAVRAAFDDLCGSQNTLKAAVLDGGKRKARVIEKVFSTGTGTFASPATASYAGSVSYQDVVAARAS